MSTIFFPLPAWRASRYTYLMTVSRLAKFFKEHIRYSGSTSTLAVFDVGSASIGGALIEIESDAALPAIRFAVRENIPFQEDLDLKRFIRQMLGTLESVVSELAVEVAHRSRSGARRPDRALAILSAPWYASAVRTISIARKTPFMLEPKQFSALIRHEAEQFKNTVNAEFIAQGIARPQLDVIESESVSIRLNGYPTNRPFGREALTYEGTVYLSSSPAIIVDGIREKIERVASGEHAALHSFSIAYYDAIRDLRPDIEDFLIADLSGEMTEVVRVREGILGETISFPLGKNFLMRALMLEYNAPAAEVFSRVSLLSQKVHDEAASAKLSRDIKPFLKQWIDEYAKAVHVLARGLLVPSTLFLAADLDVSELFAAAIKKEPAERLCASTEINIHLLDQEFFKNEIEFGAAPDPFLAIAALFSAKTHIDIGHR